MRVERDRAEGSCYGREERGDDRDAREDRPEADGDGKAGQHARRDGDDQRAIADPDRLLQPEDREQERRVLLRVADRVAGERHARGERDQPERRDGDDRAPGRPRRTQIQKAGKTSGSKTIR